MTGEFLRILGKAPLKDDLGGMFGKGYQCEFTIQFQGEKWRAGWMCYEQWALEADEDSMELAVAKAAQNWSIFKETQENT